MQDIYLKIQDAVKKREKEIVEFAKALIMTPSTSGDGKNLADLCLRKNGLTDLRFGYTETIHPYPLQPGEH